MLEAYLFLKKARIKKKVDLYKQAFMLTFDFTSVFYVGLLVSYFIYAFVSEGGSLGSIRDQIALIIPNDLSLFMPLLLYFFLINLMKGFQASGVIFSESDYKLLMLPYPPKKLWFILLGERLLSALIKYSLVGLIIVILTPISLEAMIYLVGYLLIINGLSTVIEWKMFNLHMVKKILLIFVGWCVIIGLNFLPIEIALTILIILLVGINYPLYRRLYKDVNYEAVVIAGNFKTWNIPFVSYMSKTKTVKKERQTILTRVTFFKKPLNYQTNSVNKRMLYLYLENHLKSVLQLLGVLMLLITVAYFKIPEYYYFIIGLSIIIYSSVSNAFFKGFWQTKLIEVLPARINDYKTIYIKGILLLNTPIILIYGSLLIFKDGLIGGLQLIMFIFVTYLVLALSLEEVIAKMTRKQFNYPLDLIITYLLLILTAYINYYFLTVYLILIMGIILFSGLIRRKRAR